jgi:hypothetical protein
MTAQSIQTKANLSHSGATVRRKTDWQVFRHRVSAFLSAPTITGPLKAHKSEGFSEIGHFATG